MGLNDSLHALHYFCVIKELPPHPAFPVPGNLLQAPPHLGIYIQDFFTVGAVGIFIAGLHHEGIDPLQLLTVPDHLSVSPDVFTCVGVTAEQHLSSSDEIPVLDINMA